MGSSFTPPDFWPFLLGSDYLTLIKFFNAISKFFNGIKLEKGTVEAHFTWHLANSEKKGVRKPWKGYCRGPFYTTPSKFRKKGARKPRKGHCRGPFYTTPSKFWKKGARKPQFKGYLDTLFLFPLYSWPKTPLSEGKIFYRGAPIAKVKSNMKN